jgi:hypothetical protein
VKGAFFAMDRVGRARLAETGKDKCLRCPVSLGHEVGWRRLGGDLFEGPVGVLLKDLGRAARHLLGNFFELVN